MSKRSFHSSSSPSTKRLKPSFTHHLNFNDYINYNNNKYYPPTQSIKSANSWNNGKRLKPIDIFNKHHNPKLNKEENYLVHLFKNDLRIHDNTALYNMIKDAKSIKAKPIGLYIISSEFWKSHQESAFKINFILSNLSKLKDVLSKLNIPLSIIQHDNSEYSSWLESLLISKFKTSSLYFNLNYEYDEFNRDISLLHTSLNVNAFHDQCIIKPMELTTGKGSQYLKFTPWFRKWDEYLDSHPINLLKIEKVEKWDWSTLPNESIDLIKESLPSQFKFESLSELGVQDHNIKETLEFYKPGEDFAIEKLDIWLSKIKDYKSLKDFPNETSTSRLSPYITQGIISPRYILKKCQDLNNGKRNSGNESITTYLKEVAWRDFYRHIVINWPYLMIFQPFHFIDIPWDNDYSKFEKWALGNTGFPIVDAAMKQLLQTGYMNNRCRMIVASFLSKDLNIDWRIGERWFYNHLIDADYISNLGGWNWCSSLGVDSQPWFRIFNVYNQSEKFDKNGEFIKKWLPNLKNVKNFHKPNEVDYLKPIIDREIAREETLKRFREAM